MEIVEPRQLQRPCVVHEGNCITLQFEDGEIQSRMLASDPSFLVISYTQAMTAFTLFHATPQSVIMIGLGGGSLAKWCYAELHSTDITVVEINPMVIALREAFSIPEDNHRFRVICGDGADYVRHLADSPDVLLVDGFDRHGQPAQLSSQAFYDDCCRFLSRNGLLVVNLCGPEDQQALERIRQTFEDRLLIVVPEDGENKIVFAWKGKQRWIDEGDSESIKRSLAGFMLVPFSIAEYGQAAAAK